MAENTAGYTLDGPSVRRLDALLRSEPDTTPQPRHGARELRETIFAKLGSIDTETRRFAWVEVYPDDEGAWQTVTGGRTGTTSERWAAELVPGPSVTNDIVVLKRSAARPETGDAEPCWYIVATIGRPTARYQVLTPVDDTFRPIWTAPRFTDQDI